MKTSNFPGMKQERRKGALERLEHDIEVLQRERGAMSPWLRLDPVNAAIARKEHEAKALRQRVANVTWFTKKQRA